MPVAMGSRVTLHFSLALAEGTLVESSFGEEPMTIVLGDGTLDKTLELALLGLQPGEEQNLTLTPGQAFGNRDSDGVKWLPRSRFPVEIPLEPGAIVEFSPVQGETVAGTINDVRETEVLIDFNHPLAGQEIQFRVLIIGVEDPPQEN